jgi:beta-glucosidase
MDPVCRVSKPPVLVATEQRMSNKNILGRIALALLLMTTLSLALACGSGSRSAAPPPAVDATPGTAPAGMTGPDAEKRIDAIVSKMSLEEKVDYVGGTDWFFVRAVPRLGVPALRMADGPFGVRGTSPSTAMAAGIALASTWNPTLAETVGLEIGRDARARGIHFLLGPGVNIYRAPMNGRNFEYFGEDPLLAGRIAVGYINGMQRQGVSATVKHFLANNSEFDRNRTDSVLDERTMREIYLPAFEAAVKEAKVGALMTSYNLINGVHASQNGPMITDVVKKDWGFDGVVMSDWKATYDGVGAANAGLDLEMPSGVAMNRASLLPAVKSGIVSASTIDDKVRRILRAAARFGWLDREQADLAIPTLNPRGDAVALEAARQGMVLLKNEGQILPLDRTRLKTVAVIGPLAHPGVPVGGGSAGVQPYRTVSQLEGIAAALGPNVTVLHHRGLPTFAELANRTNFTTEQNGGRAGVVVEVFGTLALEGRPAATRVEERINLVGPYVPPGPSTDPTGAFSSARWTGWFTPTDSTPHRFFLFDFRGEAGCRAMVDGKAVLDNWEVPKAQLTETTMTFTPGPHKVVLECSRRVIPGSTGVFVRLGIVPEQSIVEPAALAIAAKADVVVAALGYDAQVESESGDRPFALPGGQDLLVKGLVGANKRTIVAITSGGGVDMAGWLDSVPAVVMSWFSGQQGGTALGQLLAGDANFSGRLPITIEKSWADNPNHDSYYPAPGTKKVPYSNGVFVGYRGYERDKVAPLFPFGYGLSYTTFSFGKPVVTPKAGTTGPVYTVSFDVTNTGSRAGAAVAQVYVAPIQPKVPRPPKELKAFARVELKPGEVRRVTVELDARAFSYWDTSGRQWRADAGDYRILVGSSTADTPVDATITLK